MWVDRHLGDLIGGPTATSATVRGGQQAADAHLAAFDPVGYAAGRNEVWPVGRRGASGLSPWVRHGLLTLGRLWDHVAGAPAVDRDRFRDELLWQEYARHLYARLGSATGVSLRYDVPARAGANARDPLGAAAGMACVGLVVDELAADGWVPNQARLWLASWWSVWAGAGWRDGEDWLFARLLDGSRAANRLGWQWVTGAATGAVWSLGRFNVEHRAPGVCDGCARRGDCPIEAEPPSVSPAPRPDPDPRLGASPPRAGDVEGAGPSRVRHAGGGAPEAVWLTAESLGDADPALAAHPDLPVVFVFDAPLLARLGLSGARLAFLAETLADLATRRTVELWRGDPVVVLTGRPVAVTHAPVPGFGVRATSIAPVEVHPWPWLVRPGSGPLRSFSAWRRAIGAGTRPTT